jgi:hypothetical protein
MSGGFENLGRQQADRQIEESAQEARLGRHGGDRRSQQARADQGSGPALKRGESREYLIARLRKEGHDGLADQGVAKQMSARAAGIAAGIVKPKTPLDKLRAAWNRASPEEQDAFLAWAQTHKHA